MTTHSTDERGALNDDRSLKGRVLEIQETLGEAKDFVYLLQMAALGISADPTDRSGLSIGLDELELRLARAETASQELKELLQ